MSFSVKLVSRAMVRFQRFLRRIQEDISAERITSFLCVSVSAKRMLFWHIFYKMWFNKYIYLWNVALVMPHTTKLIAMSVENYSSATNWIYGQCSVLFCHINNSNGYCCAISANTVQICIKYVYKTMHADKYWSAFLLMTTASNCRIRSWLSW